MRYDTLLFDVDDTLLDFKAAENQALQALFGEMDVAFSKANVQAYEAINQARWQEYEKGNLTSAEVVNGRFGLFFSSLGRQVDSLATEKKYRSYLDQGHKRLGNSLEIVQNLATKANLYVVTNGVAATQYKRLTAAGLLPYFKDVFISEVVGFQKPQAEFFEYAFAKIPDFKKERTVIIGDSLSSDIKGGINAGIATIWLNSDTRTPAIDSRPNYHIQQLEELYPILAI